MNRMTGFYPKYPGTYYIARASIIFFVDLLTFFWDSLDKWLQYFCHNIETIWFLNLLAFFHIVFLQDSDLFCQKYLHHFFWNHRIFFLPEYFVFAKDALAHLDHKEIDQKSLIQTAFSHLSQHVIDLHTGLTNLMTVSFLKKDKIIQPNWG